MIVQIIFEQKCLFSNRPVNIFAEYDATAAYYTKTSVTEGIAGYPFFHFNWGFAGDYNGWYLTTGTWTAGGITYKTTNAIVDIYYK